MDRGIALTGGGALLRGLDERLREETGMPIQLAGNPLESVVLGAGKCVEDFDSPPAGAGTGEAPVAVERGDLRTRARSHRLARLLVMAARAGAPGRPGALRPPRGSRCYFNASSPVSRDLCWLATDGGAE